MLHERKPPSRKTPVKCVCCGRPMAPWFDDVHGYTWYNCRNCRHRTCDIADAEAVRHHEKSAECLYANPITEGRVCEARQKQIAHLLPDCRSVLDVGCGLGGFLRTFPGKWKRTGIDPYGGALWGVYNWIRYERDVAANAAKYGPADLVISYHAVEHVRDARQAIAACVKAAKKYVVIEIPVDRRSSAFCGHCHEFTRRSAEVYFRHTRGAELISFGHGVQRPCALGILKVGK